MFLVEDQDEVRKYTAQLLRGHGYRVIEARNGIEALPAFNAIQGEVRLLLTDVVMPGMSGRELFDRISSMHPDRPVPVLYISGYQEGILDKAADKPDPGVSILEKPFSPEELLRRVSQIISVEGHSPNISMAIDDNSMYA